MLKKIKWTHTKKCCNRFPLRTKYTAVIYAEFMYIFFCSIVPPYVILVLAAFNIDILLGLFKGKHEIFIAIVNFFINSFIIGTAIIKVWNSFHYSSLFLCILKFAKYLFWGGGGLNFPRCVWKEFFLINLEYNPFSYFGIVDKRGKCFFPLYSNNNKNKENLQINFWQYHRGNKWRLKYVARSTPFAFWGEKKNIKNDGKHQTLSSNICWAY